MKMGMNLLSVVCRPQVHKIITVLEHWFWNTAFRCLIYSALVIFTKFYWCARLFSEATVVIKFICGLYRKPGAKGGIANIFKN